MVGSVRVTTREIWAQPADLVAVIGLRGPDFGDPRSRRLGSLLGQGWMTYSSPPWSTCVTRLIVVSSELCVGRRSVRDLTLTLRHGLAAIG